METDEFTYDLTGQGCPGGAFAYTYHGSRTVWLCSVFWNAPSTGQDSRPGTVVHEHTHASAGTDDLAYGVAGCKALALQDPDKAVRNADTHEYYVERP